MVFSLSFIMRFESWREEHDRPNKALATLRITSSVLLWRPEMNGGGGDRYESIRTRRLWVGRPIGSVLSHRSRRDRSRGFLALHFLVLPESVTAGHNEVDVV
jgi:hypothetical protein